MRFTPKVRKDAIETIRGALTIQQLRMKHHIPGRINAEAQSNLKFRIAIFGSHFSKVEKSRSRHVAPSKFLARNETCKERRERNKRDVSREMDLGKGIQRETEKADKEKE